MPETPMPEMSVISYLHYLHDISRKILQRGGFENVLHGKPMKQNPYHFAYDDPDSARLSRYLRSVDVLVQEQSGRGLFWGAGLITGKIQTSTRKRNIAAPLVFAAVELFPDDEDPTQVGYEIVWDTLNLNYDLIALIIEHGSCDEPDGLDNAPRDPWEAAPGLDPTKRDCLTRIENKLDQCLDRREYRDEIQQKGTAAAFMSCIVEDIADFQRIVTSPTPFDQACLREYVATEQLTFFDHRFFFVAPVADQLSTTVALRELIRQTE